MKTVLKWNPYLNFEIAAQEQWLEEMAHDGLFFRSRLGYLTWFQPGKPAPFRRFRLEPVREGDPLSGPSPDMAELFWQAGWRYEGFYCQSLYYLFFTDDPEAPEPYTDPQSKALALEDLVGQFRREFWMSLAGMVFFLFYDLVLEPKVYSVSFTPLLLSLELLALFLLAAASRFTFFKVETLLCIVSLKCCAFQTIRPFVSWKKRGFSAHFGPGGAGRLAFHLFQGKRFCACGRQEKKVWNCLRPTADSRAVSDSQASWAGPAVPAVPYRRISGRAAGTMR